MEWERIECEREVGWMKWVGIKCESQVGWLEWVWIKKWMRSGMNGMSVYWMWMSSEMNEMSVNKKRIRSWMKVMSVNWMWMTSGMNGLSVNYKSDEWNECGWEDGWVKQQMENVWIERQVWRGKINRFPEMRKLLACLNPEIEIFTNCSASRSRRRKYCSRVSLSLSRRLLRHPHYHVDNLFKHVGQHLFPRLIEYIMPIFVNKWVTIIRNRVRSMALAGVGCRKAGQGQHSIPMLGWSRQGWVGGNVKIMRHVVSVDLVWYGSYNAICNIWRPCTLSSLFT